MKSEKDWDKLLRIDTCGRDDSNADAFRYPYEPTPYSVLERLADSGYLDEDSRLVDYGCGKGRVGFFLRQRLGCRCIGVEYDEHIYLQALENQRSFGKEGVDFVNARAEVWPPDGADSFYFFNPFSDEILRAVLRQILDSYYEEPRAMRLFFYFPSNEYLGVLMTAPELCFVDEIDCSDLFEGNRERERILIFEVN